MSNPTALVQKLWNYCNILRDDGCGERQKVERRMQKLEKSLKSVSSAVNSYA